MGELGERRWAVMSERGREASGLSYDDALERERGLKARGASGLCIVTDEAARRLRPSPEEARPAKRGDDAKAETARGGDSGRGGESEREGKPKRSGEANTRGRASEGDERA